MTATTLDDMLESTAIVISEIHCLHCAACLEDTIIDVPGVVAATVDGSTGLVELSYRPSVLRITDLIEALQGLGLRAS
jgi:copper chaperone CopZ